MDEELKQEWDVVMKRLELQFGEGIEIEGILLLIGTQELGKGYLEYTKDEKLDVLHIALCTLLEPLGYYTFKGKDADGWPHWEATNSLPSMKAMDQKDMVRKAIVDYFKKMK